MLFTTMLAWGLHYHATNRRNSQSHGEKRQDLVGASKYSRAQVALRELNSEVWLSED